VTVRVIVVTRDRRVAVGVIVVAVVIGLRRGRRVRVSVVGAPVALGATSASNSCSRVEVIAQVERELLGAQHLARLVRGAVVGAAAALGAGVEVEDRLPAEVLDAGDAHGRGDELGLLASAFITSSPMASAFGRDRGQGGPAARCRARRRWGSP
jgi:hypothetical protein